MDHPAKIVPYYKYANEYVVISNIRHLHHIIDVISKKQTSEAAKLLIIAGIKAWIFYIYRGGRFANLCDDIMRKICRYITGVFNCPFNIYHLRSRHGFVVIAQRVTDELLIYAKLLNTMLVAEGSAVLRYNN